MYKVPFVNYPEHYRRLWDEVMEAIEGAKALIERLGYADAARFIAIMGGEGDSVKDIREKRTQSDIDEITERIKMRRSYREIKEESKGDIL